MPRVALVGYTNAGKSTLFHALTGGRGLLADQLFATLDPTLRRCYAARRGSSGTGRYRGVHPRAAARAGRCLPLDPAGGRGADLLLHVVDASDPRRDEHILQVDAVLREIGAGDIPQLRVYNKIDRLGLAAERDRDAQGHAAAVWISAAAGTGIELLREAVAERLDLQVQRLWLHLPAASGALRARLYAEGAVRDERTLEDGALEMLVELPATALAAWAVLPGVRLLEAQPHPHVPACAGEQPYLESSAEPMAAIVRS